MEIIVFGAIVYILYMIAVDIIKKIIYKKYRDSLKTFYDNLQNKIPKQYLSYGEDVYCRYSKKEIPKKDIEQTLVEFEIEYFLAINKTIYEKKAKSIFDSLNKSYMDTYIEYKDELSYALGVKHYRYGNYYYRVYNKYKKYDNSLSPKLNKKRLDEFEYIYNQKLFKLISGLIEKRKNEELIKKKKDDKAKRDKLYIEKYGKELAEYLNPTKKLSAEELGLRFERYIGYIYEESGYNNVNYNGATQKKADGGIDLIIITKEYHIIIQCKYYGKNSLIHENSINQFYSAFLKYKKRNPFMEVVPIFVTAYDNLDSEARESLYFFKEIIHKVYAMSYPLEYPTIKCNINKHDKRKIYHLPTDPNYDRIKIDINRGNLYCFTPSEAESLGFIRSRNKK